MVEVTAFEFDVRVDFFERFLSGARIKKKEIRESMQFITDDVDQHMYQSKTSHLKQLKIKGCLNK